MQAFVGLGGNLGDPAARIREAVAALRGLPGTHVADVSSLYRNPPLGPPGQPDYVNAVAALDTTLAPLELLDALQAIERDAGRVRGGERWGPRTLDLDLLVYGDLRLHTPRLTVPHPEAHARSFVVHPLAEIAPDALIPGRGRARALARAVDGSDLVSLGPAD